MSERRSESGPSVANLLSDYDWRVHEDLKAEGRRAMARPTGIAKIRSFHLLGLVTLIERIYEATPEADESGSTEP